MTIQLTPSEPLLQLPQPLQEALRVIGQTLEVQQVPRVGLSIGSDGIVVGTTANYPYRQYTWADLAVQSRTQAELRRPVGRRAFWDPRDLTRWSVLLRVTGSLLDARGVRRCTIQAAVGDTPAECGLAVHGAGELLLDRATIEDFVLWSRLRRGAMAPLDAAERSETDSGRSDEMGPPTLCMADRAAS
jgi:hypothetical protein